MRSVMYPGIGNFPSSCGDEYATMGSPGFSAPLSFISLNQLEAMQFSLERTVRETFQSEGKVASARGYLRNLEKSYKSVCMEQHCHSHGELIQRQKFLNTNLLKIIALTDKHEDTIGHSQLVARYTLLLAEYLGAEDVQFMTDLERGALLHDIGKIGIPESILRKPGRLTKAEKKIVEEHSLLGYELIEEYDFLKKAAQVVLYHHEHFDGKGYPFGLKGEEIPVEARIFALADTLDAITSDRPYRKGSSFEKALEEIENHSKTQFDPLLVDMLLSIPVEEWRQIKEEPFGYSPSTLTH